MKLKDFMKSKKLSERELAKLFGISQQHINYILRGLKNPSLELARIIEKTTDGKVTIDELFNPKAPSRLKNRKKKAIK